MPDYTRHQKGIIRRYYAQEDQLAFQRLTELVGELYLAEGKKRERLWENAAAALSKLDIPAARATTVLASKDPAALAELIQDVDRKLPR